MIFKFKKCTAIHYAWVERMGWHNKNRLETLALIFSEVGESGDEFVKGKITSKFGEELADIVLRVIDFAAVENIDVDTLIDNFENEERGVLLTGTNAHEVLAYVTSDLSKAVNDCRKEQPTAILGRCLASVLVRVTYLANMYQIDLEAEIGAKLAINETRGTRGRLI